MLQVPTLKNARRVLAVAGPLLLLLAWLTQQFLFDRWNGALNRLNSAEAVWDVYRSTHYLFNAIRPDGLDEDEDKKAAHPTVIWQLRNLQIGSGRLEAALRPSTLEQAKGDVNESEDGGFGGPDGTMDLQFKTLKLALDRERIYLNEKKAAAQVVFWLIYAIGAALTFCATFLKEHIDAREGK